MSFKRPQWTNYSLLLATRGGQNLAHRCTCLDMRAGNSQFPKGCFSNTPSSVGPGAKAVPS
eukprot:scaffold10769_cov49-Phaeocystis_antarctica.AAC.5